MSSPAQTQIRQFLSHAEPGPFRYEACHHFPGQGRSAQHVVLGFAIHGNEHGSLPAALALQQRLGKTPPAGPVTLLLGNVEAAERDVRFLDEDFNRVFTFDRLADSRERKRAELVRPILDACDVFLDFHQTQTPTESAFWTFPWSRQLGLLATALRLAPRGLTRRRGQSFSAGLRCLDEYVRDQGKLGLTVELGLRGQDPAQAARAFAGAIDLLRIVDAVARGESSLEGLAAQSPPVAWFETAQIVPSEPPRLRLREGLRNWSPLTAGEELAAPGTGSVRCPFDGYALFPKYPAPGELPPPELLRIARAVADPDRAFTS